MANEDLSKLKIEKSTVTGLPKRRKNRTRWIVAALLMIITGFLYAKGVFTPAVEVEVATVSRIYPSQAFTLLNASGYVVAQRKAAVASKVTARLVALHVEEGMKVKGGEVIARLENEDAAAVKEQAAANLNIARAALEQAKAELRDATLSYTRGKELADKGFIAKAEHDAAEARYRKALAAVESAEAGIRAGAATLKAAEVQLEYALIRAPFDAVVLTKNADVGDIVTPLGAAANAKASVVTIADMESLQVEADVSESSLEKVNVGQPCEIELDAFPESRFRGIVHMIVPTADRSKATVLVKVRFLDRNNRVLPEMSAKVAFLERSVKPDEQTPVTALNPKAVLTRNGRKTVFLVKNDLASEVPVTLGGPVGDMVEVVSGVKAGDRVVLKHLEKLRDGTRVKVAEK